MNNEFIYLFVVVVVVYLQVHGPPAKTSGTSEETVLILLCPGCVCAILRTSTGSLCRPGSSSSAMLVEATDPRSAKQGRLTAGAWISMVKKYPGRGYGDSRTVD